MSAALSRASIVSAALGLGVGVTISYIYYRLKSPKGRYENPNWGLLRVRGVKLAQQASRDSAAQAARSMAAATATQAIADAGAELSRNDSTPLADLPESILKKHPKGCGMQLVKIDAPVSTVGMFPVSNLRDFYESESRENVMGSGMVHDYNQKLAGDAIIYGDIVRKPGMVPFSRAYLRAGPRKTLYFSPRDVKAAIVTCGGLCPGLNNIIKDVTLSLFNLYGAAAVYGVVGGYRGFDGNTPPKVLTCEMVAEAHMAGGTILGTSRGGFDLDKIFAYLKKYDISQLYVCGGDGTHRAANKIGLEALARKLNIAVAGIPKTIDNDLDLVDRSFGFNSAVGAAQDAIVSAKTEAKCNLPNGIGIVKLMGRHAGFVAAHATLASGMVDLCLVPEVPVVLRGTYGCLPHLERVIKAKGHAVVVVAEGAGEALIGAEAGTDAGGNKKLPEIGPYFKKAVSDYFAEKGTEVTIKYIDPSYMIRSVPANSSDAIFCTLLAQNAVHGAMAGYTCFTTGLVCNRTVYIPIPAIVENSPRMMDRTGRTWERIVTVTGQPNAPCDDPAQLENAIQPATIF